MHDIERVIKKIRLVNPSSEKFIWNLHVQNAIRGLIATVTFGTISSFWLRKPLMSASEIRSEWLPEEKGIVLLNDAEKWHFIFAVFGRIMVVFAPHFLLFNSRKWIRLSRKLGAILGLVDFHYDMDFCSYTLFAKGKHICNAAWNKAGIHQSKMAPMEFYLNGKLIYKVKEEKDLLTQELKDFIAEDVIIDIDKDRRVRFKKPLTENEYHEPTAVRHIVFPARWDVVPNYKKYH